MGPELLRLGLALSLGPALGLVYDLLRPLRHRAGPLPALGLDLLYALFTGGSCFFFAMSAGNGRMGLWELTASLLGFLLYLHTLSPKFLRFWEASLRGGWSIIGFCKKRLKKSWIFVKKHFQNLSK